MAFKRKLANFVLEKSEQQLRFAEILSNIHLLMSRTIHSIKTWPTPDILSNFIELAFQRFFKTESYTNHVEISWITSWALRISATAGRNYTAWLRLKHINTRRRRECLSLTSCHHQRAPQTPFCSLCEQVVRWSRTVPSVCTSVF